MVFLNIKMALKNIKNMMLFSVVFFLLCACIIYLTSFMSIERKHEALDLKQHYGLWQISTNNDELFDVYQPEKIGHMNIIESINKQNKQLIMCSFDKEMFELANLKLIDGRLPTLANEVIIDIDEVTSFKIPYKLDNELELTINGSVEKLTVVGFYQSIKSKWIINPFLESYPSIITTNRKSDKVVFFGYMSDQVRLAQVSESWVLNSLSYPNLDIQRGLDQIEYENNLDVLVKEQSRLFSLSACVLTCFIIINMFYVMSFSMRKKIRNLKLINASRGQLIVLIFFQSILYLVLAWILFKFAETLINQLFSLKYYQEAIVFNWKLISLNKCILFIVIVCSYLIINGIHIRQSLFENKSYHHVRRLRIKKLMMHFTYGILFSSISYILIKTSFDFYSFNFRLYQNIIASQKVFPSYVFLSTNCNDHNCGFNEDFILQVSKIKGVDQVETIKENVVDLQFEKVSPYKVAILNDSSVSLVDQWMHDKVVDSSFLKGQVIYLITNDNSSFPTSCNNVSEVLIPSSKTKIQYRVLCPNQHKNLITGSPLQTYVLNENRPFQIVVHESFANRLNINKVNVDYVFVRTNNEASFRLTDNQISKINLGEKELLENLRLRNEISNIVMKKDIYSKLFMVVISLLLVGSILGNYILFDIKNQKNNIGLKRLIGQSKISLILHAIIANGKAFFLSIFAGFGIFIFDIVAIQYQKFVAGLSSDEMVVSWWDFLMRQLKIIKWDSILILLVLLLISAIIISGFICYCYFLVFKENPLENIKERNQ